MARVDHQIGGGVLSLRQFSAGASWQLSNIPVSATNLLMSKCPEYERLHTELENILGNLAQTTTLLLELFRAKDLDGVHNLDKQLELTIGEKERSIGALRQHIKEHNCVQPL